MSKRKIPTRELIDSLDSAEGRAAYAAAASGTRDKKAKAYQREYQNIRRWQGHLARGGKPARKELPGTGKEKTVRRALFRARREGLPPPPPPPPPPPLELVGESMAGAWLRQSARGLQDLTKLIRQVPDGYVVVVQAQGHARRTSPPFGAKQPLPETAPAEWRNLIPTTDARLAEQQIGAESVRRSIEKQFYDGPGELEYDLWWEPFSEESGME